MGFFVAEPERSKFQYETTTQIKKAKKKKQTTLSWKKKRQLGGFLNRYGLGYEGRDTVNQAAKFAPGVIKNAGNEIKKLKKKLKKKLQKKG